MTLGGLAHCKPEANDQYLERVDEQLVPHVQDPHQEGTGRCGRWVDDQMMLHIVRPAPGGTRALREVERPESALSTLADEPDRRRADRRGGAFGSICSKPLTCSANSAGSHQGQGSVTCVTRSFASSHHQVSESSINDVCVTQAL